MKKDTKANLEKQGWRPCKIDNKMDLTLLDAIEQIIMLAENSALCPQFYRSAKRPLQYICDKLQLTTEQALLFSVFINFSDNINLEMTDITRFLACTQIKILRMSKDIDELMKRRIISKHKGCYIVKKATLQAVKENTELPVQKIDNLSLGEFFSFVQQYIDDKECNEEYEFDMFVKDIEELFDKNSRLPFVKQLRQNNLSPSEIIVFLKGCCMLIYEDDNVITQGDFRWLLNARTRANVITTQLNNGTSKLVSANLLEPQCEDGAVCPGCFCLTSKVCNQMLADAGITGKKELKLRNMIKANDITIKQLFYNPNEQSQISQLEELLHPSRFNEVCDRLSAQGMRRGFACIFYGAPGTGKTETALQLARKTGRNVIMVNVSELRDKYVGESEKRVKALFDNYRKAIESSNIAPILLFNEADAIISKRTENIERSVDKMENAIQNIILQEMENLEGILIATTNLSQNMDSAFERRFLYKVEFKRPSLQAKQAIWKSMIPSLSEQDAMTLAEEYEFSGGQIENIARKQTVEQVLTGTEPNIDTLRKICNTEHLHTHPTNRRIGF